MAGGRIRWVPTQTDFPEGTSPASHYVAHLGTLTSPNKLLTDREHVFPNLSPGDYPSSVDTVAVDGTLLATHAGPVLHVPTPVVIGVAANVSVELVP